MRSSVELEESQPSKDRASSRAIVEKYMSLFCLLESGIESREGVNLEHLYIGQYVADAIIVPYS